MSLENEGTKEEVQEVNFLDEVLGGEEAQVESHSPENEVKAELTPPASEQDDDADALIPEDEDEDVFDEDSTGDDDGKKENTPPADTAKTAVPDTEKLKQEIEVLNKRLHDTQAAMHKANGERSALQKELDELKAKKENNDDWFSEEDDKREKELAEKVKQVDETISQGNAEEAELKQKNALAQWDIAAAPVIAEHPDFEKVVYGKLVPMLDEKNGNAQIRKEWENLEDKSPAGTYAFAVKVMDKIDFLTDPEAYKERLRKSFQNKPSQGTENTEVTGKAGLDMLQSADAPEKQYSRNVSFVDAVFGN